MKNVENCALGIQVPMMEEHDLELVAHLRALGMTRAEAFLTAYLSAVENTTSRQIEFGAGLRQPDVSNGLKMLGSRGWIEEQERRTKKKGRPMKIYKLKVTSAEIVQYIEEKKAQDTEQAKANIQRLKDLAPYL
jgi:predicted transcriptional regulator